jgi:hypothetical protein
VGEPLASRLLFPLTQRRFTYGRYDEFLARLSSRRVVPLREFARGEGDLGLRHDVDSRLDSALVLARRERDRGVRATYFILHTADYWERPDLVDRLRELAGMGHEIGLHHDLLTVHRRQGRDPRATLAAALERLRGAGLEVVGAAAHGSPWCHRLGYHNNYVFAGWDEPIDGFPATAVPEKLEPEEFGLAYEAYHLPCDAYFSDARLDRWGRRWHPADLPPPGGRTIVLVHPCHWDASPAAKAGRLAGRLARRLTGR